jgi:hypothetical protein
VVRSAFGKSLDFKDIYEHVTNPERVYLLLNGKVSAMASYNRRILSGFPSLIVEGIAVDPTLQGRGFFRSVTDIAREEEAVICLRTQNPRMYRALENYCSYIYPCATQTPNAVKEVLEDLARHMNCQIDEKYIVRGCYGGLFYGEEPTHKRVSSLFDTLEMELNKGDALLVAGIK